MKIIYIHHSKNLGGAPKSLAYLVDGLKKMTKYNITVYAPKKGPGTDFISKYNHDIRFDRRIIPFHNSTVSSTNLRKKLKGIYGIFIAPFFIYSIKKENPKIIHLNSSCLVFYSIFIKLLMKNTKVVCHLREPLLDNFLSKLFIYCLRNFVDSVIAISQNEIPKQLSATVSVINNPIYPLLNKPSNDYSKNKHSKKITFVYMARCNYENGVFDFIDLAKISNDNGIEAEFLIVGAHKNDDPKVMESSSNLSNLKIVNMSDNIHEFISIASCLIVPFKVPHFSRTLIEFGLYGVPAIVYDINPLNKIIRTNFNGYVCDPDLYSLNIMTERIVKNKYMLNKISENVYGDFSARYNTNKTVESVISIYGNLI